MTQLLQADDPRLTWQGIVSLERTQEWVMPWRIPYQEQILFPQDRFLGRAKMPAGGRISFYSNTTTLAGKILRADPESSPIDLCCNGEFIASRPLAGKTNFEFQGLAEGEKFIELWLPQFGEGFRLQSLHISEGAMVRLYDDTRPRWITYGSSITQCRHAESPVKTWPAIVGRKLGLNLTNLGFGGECHLDTMMARMIRELPADMISLCLGINIYGGATLAPRNFRSEILGFVRILREKHPNIPLILLSPIYSLGREDTPNAVGFTLKMMRAEISEALNALQAYGDHHVYYVDGLKMFGSKYAHLLPDDLHPNTEGYAIMGDYLTGAFDKILKHDNNNCELLIDNY